jgi:hypothetical protein
VQKGKNGKIDQSLVGQLIRRGLEMVPEELAPVKTNIKKWRFARGMMLAAKNPTDIVIAIVREFQENPQICIGKGVDYLDLENAEGFRVILAHFTGPQGFFYIEGKDEYGEPYAKLFSPLACATLGRQHYESWVADKRPNILST